MANPRRRRIRKVSRAAADVARAAGNADALAAAEAIHMGCHTLAEAAAAAAKVEAMCASKPAPAAKPAELPPGSGLQ